MSRSARDSAAARALLQHVDKKSTGRLTVGAGAAEIAVYLLHGDIVAATTPDDDRQLLRLARLVGAVDAKQGAFLEALSDAEEPVYVQLMELADQTKLEQLLADRFRSNVCDFASSISKPAFTAMKSIFVDNIQIGHETRALIEECLALVDKATALDLELEIVAGMTQPKDPRHKAILRDLGTGRRTVSSLLHTAPLEPIVARAAILAMLNTGSVMRAAGLEAETEHDDDEPRVRTGDLTAEATFEGSLEEETRRGTRFSQVAEPTIDTSADEEDPYDDDMPTAEVPLPNVSDDHRSAGNLSSLEAWLSTASQVAEDELDFFEDHDATSRSGGAPDAGRFSTGHDHLDKVEVAEMDDRKPAPAASSDNDVIAVDEVPAARFGAPVLSEDEALSKIEVANQVIAQVVAAFDAVEGAGRGRAVVQLLVDGAPSRAAILLNDLQVDEHGQMPPTDILSNLYGRPPGEHRGLLNESLIDLLERALSSAADELPEESFDHVYESVAGFRQRLGL